MPTKIYKIILRKGTHKIEIPVRSRVFAMNIAHKISLLGALVPGWTAEWMETGIPTKK